MSELNGIGVKGQATMSKHEREPQSYAFSLEIGNERFICTSENTFGYLYTNTDYDHIFIKTNEDDGTMYGFHIFRHVMGDQFDKMIKKMIKNGFEVYSEDEPNEVDMEAYRRSKPAELETHEVSQRGENKIAFLGYLLVNEHLTADDFKGDNELYI